MFFGMCIYETLYEDGRLESIIITPSKKSRTLVADHLRDVGPNLSRNVDIGPLRFYMEEEGLSVRTIVSRLAKPAFQASGSSVTFQIEHRHWPLPESHAGYYILLLPPGFAGSIKTSAEYPELKFMEDTHQLLLAATVYPHRPSISVEGALKRNDHVPADVEHTTATEVFKSHLPGVHYTPVDNLLKALRHDLAKSPTAFLCHSSTDKPSVRRLAIELATRGVRPWIDEAEIQVGDSLIEKIQTGITTTTCLLPILSCASVTSRWCKEELRMALAIQISSGIKGVLPVLIEDCDIPGFLIEKAYADLRKWDSYSANVDRLASAVRDVAQAT